ncbi:MAG: ATP phosphoribosyltransferase regulatory subunit [Clostridia bacterium]|nr:ATP phosphoribosyltransferase regulatory subunit [Clostridia bacterium]
MITSIKNEERIVFSLRSLYGGYGYSRYKMSKFEEYELYVRNKDFLISDSVITFTDTNGKLMALKPDVTLSIVKNGRDIPGYVQKVYYNENVYRVSRGSHSFKEIMQVGLECIGDIDSYCILEVVELAARSLNDISENAVLNISHLGVISDLIGNVDGETRQAIMNCIREKNAHELSRACEAAGMGEKAELLNCLLTTYGSPDEVIPALKRRISSPALDQLEALASALRGSGVEDMLRIDFSVVNDVNYYNGIVFRGYIEGVPQGVLSGGQYDRLMAKLGRKSGAIGFAVYLDQLERLHESDKKDDVDVLLVYDEGADIAGLQRAMARLRASGSVTAQRQVPEKLRYRQLARYRNGEVEILEDA